MDNAPCTCRLFGEAKEEDSDDEWGEWIPGSLLIPVSTVPHRALDIVAGVSQHSQAVAISVKLLRNHSETPTKQLAKLFGSRCETLAKSLRCCCEAVAKQVPKLWRCCHEGVTKPLRGCCELVPK